MQGADMEMMRWPMPRKRTGFTVFVVVLAFLAGCSAGKNIQPVAGVDESPMAEGVVVDEWPSVTRLEDGRQGFVIREKPDMDGKWTEDFERAVEKMQHQDYRQAIDLLEKVLAQSPGVTPPYIDIAICYARTGKPEQAEQNLKTALELIPDHPVASNEYGLLLRKAGRFDEARAIYEKALATFPEYLPLRRNLGILCDLYLNDQACALEQYKAYSKAKPEDEQVKIWIAEISLRVGGGG